MQGARPGKLGRSVLRPHKEVQVILDSSSAHRA